MTIQEQRPLTAIRGVAAMWVLLLHTLMTYVVSKGAVNWTAPDPLIAIAAPGIQAVDAFFVLSGYILSTVYAELPARGVPLFLLKRVFRIYPLHLAVMGWMGAAILLRGEPARWDHFWLVLGLQQVAFADAPDWNFPSWSASVELVCYLAFPVALGLPGRMTRRPWPTCALLAVAVVVELAVQWFWLTSGLGRGAFLRGFAGVGLGMVLRRVTLVGPRVSARLATMGELAALTGILACTLLRPLAWRWLVPLPVCWAGLILALSVDRGLVAGLLRRSVPVWLGRISFSI
jgi:peptidoglycan/LPS O-acetylase OafA/YrhL